MSEEKIITLATFKAEIEAGSGNEMCYADCAEHNCGECCPIRTRFKRLPDAPACATCLHGGDKVRIKELEAELANAKKIARRRQA